MLGEAQLLIMNEFEEIVKEKESPLLNSEMVL